jgi:hypothetical protein
MYVVTTPLIHPQRASSGRGWLMLMFMWFPTSFEPGNAALNDGIKPLHRLCPRVVSGPALSDPPPQTRESRRRCDDRFQRISSTKILVVAATYSVSILALWLISGRRSGAESYLLDEAMHWRKRKRRS